MAYITENSEFADGNIPLLDTATPVQGYDGTSIGPANEQAQFLANRTLWLKEGLDAANQSVAAVVDTAEKIKLTQASIEKRLTTVEDAVETADKASISRDTQLEVKMQDQKRVLDTNISALDFNLKQLDHRESSNSQTAARDISALKTTVKQVSDSTDQLSTSVNNVTKKVTSLTTDVDSLTNKTATLTKDVNALKETASGLTTDLSGLKSSVDVNTQDIASLQEITEQHTSVINEVKTSVSELDEKKQDKLESGTNINTVFGTSLLEVKDGGITLGDAKDFAQVMKSHLAVGSGLTLTEAEDGQTLTFDAVSSGGGGTGLGTNLTIKKQSARANREYEYRPAARPTSYNVRAYAFKSEAERGGGDVTVNFDQNTYNSPTSPWDDDGIRISFLNDETSAHWSALNSISIDSSVFANTRVAFSRDGEEWYTYLRTEGKWGTLGKLTTDKDSAVKLADRGVLIKDFGGVDIAPLRQWLSSSETPPALNVAFAGTGLTNESHRFVPASLTASVGAVSSWSLQPLSSVSVAITQDTIIFKPNSDGDYVFCYELLK